MMELLNIVASGRVAQKASHMAQTDPQGWTLTLVSICVVFGVLFILFLAYYVSGSIFTGKLSKSLAKKAKRNQSIDYQTVAAVSLALDRYLNESLTDDEIAAAVAALEQYRGDEAVHDRESLVITIKRQ